MMLSVLLSVTLILTGSSGLTPNEWKEATVQIFSNVTRWFNHGMFGENADLFSDDAEVMFPLTPVTGKEGMVKAQERIMELTPLLHSYLAYVDLLYSSPDVAVVWDVGIEQLTNGSYTQTRGLMLFVREGGRIQIRMNVFNFL